MRHSWTLAAAAALSLTLSCQEAGGGFTAAEVEIDEVKTHLTAAEFADKLAEGVMPNIDWITWNLEGRPRHIFPLELRTPEEIAVDLREKGVRLPNGNYQKLKFYHGGGPAARELTWARRQIIRSLQPPSCPFFPCENYPGWEAQIREFGLENMKAEIRR